MEGRVLDYIRQYESIDEILLKRRELCDSDRQNFTDGVYCPQEFDGWSCVPSTPAGEIAQIRCPFFVPGFDGDRDAYRPCLDNGSWFRHPESNKTWTNYSTCIDHEDLQLRDTVNLIYKFGYTISLLALLLSLLIFYYFKSLSCTRIQIHKNLFLSLAINNLLWLVWYQTVIDNVVLLFENQIYCQLLHILVMYFMVSTYFWMFCEGIYLHTVLVVTFLPENKVMFYLHCIGWGIPAFLVTIYAILRASSRSESVSCWINESKYSMILRIPVGLSMITNLVFLINIVRILVKKLPSCTTTTTTTHTTLPLSNSAFTPRNSVKQKTSFRMKSIKKRSFSRTESQETAASSGRMKKAVRATLILIPLLGLQYILMFFKPENGDSWEPTYEVLSAIVVSLQGIYVALLFCFCNGEILSTIRRKWNQNIMNKRRSWQPCSATTTISFSRSSLLQHHHNHQQHVPLRSHSQTQIENEIVSPTSGAFRVDGFNLPAAVSL